MLACASLVPACACSWAMGRAQARTCASRAIKQMVPVASTLHFS
jgi:hypothetical protein